MEKIKAFIIKYKWWVAGGAVALIAVYLLRGSGGSGSGSGVIQTSYTTSDGSIGNTYTDPSLMLAQLESQTLLASQTADLQSQLNLASIEKDVALQSLDLNRFLGEIDSNTQIALGNLNSNTQTSIANINANSANYLADAGVKTSQIGANVAFAEFDAMKYVSNKQYDIAKYEAQTARRGQEYGAIQGLLNWGGGFFK